MWCVVLPVHVSNLLELLVHRCTKIDTVFWQPKVWSCGKSFWEHEALIVFFNPTCTDRMMSELGYLSRRLISYGAGSFRDTNTKHHPIPSSAVIDSTVLYNLVCGGCF